MTATLASRAAAFADEVQQTLDGTLPGSRRIVSTRGASPDRYIVGPEGATAEQRRIPVEVEGEHLASLSLSLYLDLDHRGQYLKTVRSDIVLHSVLDRTPLLRLDYRADMRTAPVSHWQMHSERGAFTHLLARAHSCRPGKVSRPHDLSSLHLPTGGERFRPCLEDMLQFLVVDCGADSVDGWQDVVEEGRQRWRRRQLRSAVRDTPTDAAGVLKELGWYVVEPDVPNRQNLAPQRRW